MEKEIDIRDFLIFLIVAVSIIGGLMVLLQDINGAEHAANLATFN